MMITQETANEGTLRILTLNNPEKRNALSDALLLALVEAVEDAAQDEACLAIAISGAGGVFAAGADVNRFTAFDRVSVRTEERPEHWQRLSRCHKPMIAAVEGWCLGAGMELALMCDIIVAGKGAVFGLPEVGLAIMPTAGGTQRLPRSVSKSDAMLMVLAAERISAEEALAMRIISRLGEQGTALELAKAIGAKIARNAPLAVENAKRSVLKSYEMPLAAGIASERDLYVQNFGTEDREEGIRAFLEKRTPEFRRR